MDFFENQSLNKNQVLKIKEVIRELGFPLNILGYKYICDAVFEALNSSNLPLMKEIYGKVAKKNLTSALCVEASIRNGIKKASKLKKPAFVQIFKDSDSLSNSLFLISLKNFFERDFLI